MVVIVVDLVAVLRITRRSGTWTGSGLDRTGRGRSRSRSWRGVGVGRRCRSKSYRVG